MKICHSGIFHISKATGLLQGAHWCKKGSPGLIEKGNHQTHLSMQSMPVAAGLAEARYLLQISRRQGMAAALAQIP